MVDYRPTLAIYVSNILLYSCMYIAKTIFSNREAVVEHLGCCGSHGKFHVITHNF